MKSACCSQIDRGHCLSAKLYIPASWQVYVYGPRGISGGERVVPGMCESDMGMADGRVSNGLHNFTVNNRILVALIAGSIMSTTAETRFETLCGLKKHGFHFVNETPIAPGQQTAAVISLEAKEKQPEPRFHSKDLSDARNTRSSNKPALAADPAAPEPDEAAQKNAELKEEPKPSGLVFLENGTTLTSETVPFEQKQAPRAGRCVEEWKEAINLFPERSDARAAWDSPLLAPHV
ncbi:hypothetical protein QBC43DRAFT_339090 [Cladorrhinum sp. PSN259]|nr:hypothetical protein QBC43DRAFT_339090 [Cladorrhinum sp. PSN259]